MPTISNEKQIKIKEQILYYLYQTFPKQVFISDIAEEIARDEEFVKVLMFDLLKKGAVIKVDKNSNGVIYSRRSRWRLANKAQEAYSRSERNSS